MFFANVGNRTQAFDVPDTFQAAWNDPIQEIRKKWRSAIRKEFHDMIRRGVWRYTNKQQISKNRRLIGCKWVFKLKNNGVYRARLCALGYSQIPGVDYTDNFAPVVTDTTFCMLTIQWLVNGWDSEIIDVETAFLYGDLENVIYIKIPEGLNLYLRQEFKKMNVWNF